MTGGPPSRSAPLAMNDRKSSGRSSRSLSITSVRRGGLAIQNPSLKRLALAGALTRRANSPFSHSRSYTARPSQTARTCLSPRRLSDAAELEMRSRIESLEEELATIRGKARRQELHAEIMEIAKSSFGQQGETRAALQRRVTELEGELMRIKEDLASEKQRADGMAAELQQKRRGAEELEQRVLTLTEENYRMRAEADRYNGQAIALESRLSFLTPSLTEEDRDRLGQVIAEIINNRPAAFVTLGSVGDTNAEEGEGSPGKLTVNTLSRMVDTLRQEKSDLVDEIQSLRKMLQIEAGISADLRKLMEARALESRERTGDLIKVSNAERDKWQRLASSRDLQVKQLQKRLAESRKSHIPASISEGRRTAVSSDGGFSDLSEIPDLSLNSLDVILSKGTLDGAIIHSLGFPVGQDTTTTPTETLMSVILVSFYDFDLCVSDAAAGLNPNYRTTLSFPGLDMIDDSNLWGALETEGLRLELEAFQVGATAAGAGGAVIGTSHISLGELLQRQADTNPTISGEAVFTVTGSTDMPETLGFVRYKIRFRHPIVDHYEQWKQRKMLERDLGRRGSRCYLSIAHQQMLVP
ncbi:hypothetical protein Pmar_PMAR018056 [Perkinsus marinus ATCC 50983]|uniref:RPGR-interacting protein 1 first C2 domain-containing protein n=1 Tax=Perkinsus marinus (strain ATCC 50983 / TXsc) TaxID=423536 RepID=C5KRW0_PERM5|nr:hypothetical protein Pmar_PMAR018056 [Perkinsus marinus ATCC 50983]EER12801.1 hypothetical protein Pmar_PMAR018056 [Perkinsus marinus ATCC 50983]|eukprot:XP_002781006.1 hypothetical protein Pmar_PMAR018056 [Perkinsus marinus ATCC 50983]